MRRFSFLGTALATLAIGGLLPVTSAQAQNRTVHAGEGELRLEVPKDFAKDKDSYDTFMNLRKGSQEVTAADEPLLELAAKWYAYRLTDPAHQDPPEVDRPHKSMHEVVREAWETIPDPRTREGINPPQQRFADKYGKLLTARLTEVVKNPKPIARVNAARLLAQLAATGQEEATDVLADVINDPKENDGVKKYALQGLGDFFALGRKDDQQLAFKKKDREGRCIAALLDYLTRKPSLGPDASPQEWVALSIVRREAVTALGQTRYPAHMIVDEKKKKDNITIQQPTALVLLRIARRAAAGIEPTMSERVAAAAGLCQLQSKSCPDYQVDYATWQLGQFLVEFLTAYNGKQGKEPWKIHAARLLAALDQLKEDAQTGSAKALVDKFVAQAKKELDRVIDPKNENPKPGDLAAYLDASQPTGKSVYRSMEKDSKIEVIEKTADDAEKEKDTGDK